MKNIEPISDKDFDKIFHDKLHSFEVEPSESVWTGVANELNKQKKRKAFPVLWLAAASLAAVVSAGIWFASQKEPMKLTGTVDQEVPAKLEITQVPASKETIANNQVPSVVSEKVSQFTNVVSKPESKTLVAQKTRAKIAVVAEANVTESIEPVNVIAKTQKAEEESIVSKQSQILALAAESEKNPRVEIEESEIQRKPKAFKSVGSLVNFVVSKVDKRKNKIIEFEDGDEGTMVSSLNLGLLKFQAKQ